MTEPDADLAALFRDEAAQRIDAIDAALLAVEAGEAGRDVIGDMFRQAHTIKGAAGMVGLDDIRVVAHKVEDLLAGARDTGTLPAGLVPVLLRATAVLRGQVTGDSSPAGPVLDELTAAREGLRSGAPAGQAAERAAAARAPGPVPSGAGREPTVRVPAGKVDRMLDLAGEAALHHRRLEHAVSAADLPEDVAGQLGAGRQLLGELKESAARMRTLPVSAITGPLPRAVRDLARGAGKEVEFTVTGADTELDRAILESLAEPLTHLLRNAITHGIEPPAERQRAGKPAAGRLELRAVPQGSLVAISVTDDGRGIGTATAAHAQAEGSLTDVLTRPGYSTADEVTDLAGRGVGLDAVQAYARSAGGTLEVRSEPGCGLAATLVLPLALAQLEVMLLERGPDVYGIPIAAVEEVVRVTATRSLQGRPAVAVRGHPVPVADVAMTLGLPAPPLPDHPPAVIVSAAGRRAAAQCDRLIGGEEVLVKPLGPLLRADGCLGATILGDGRIALLLEPGLLTRGAVAPPAGPAAGSARPGPAKAASTILVVEDSFTVRELQRSIFEAAGYPVVTARDGREALDALHRDPQIAAVVSDLEMPGLDGLDLTRAVRADARRSELPVIIVTARGTEEARQEGMAAGASAFMAKGRFDQQELLATVGSLVGRLPGTGCRDRGVLP
ncbi:MAG TPA: response regulator [Streptosporangiaceae bacterium]|nr:response regulator [Streptosporangiaceae bacterium]